ncbi:hypothetical protein BASA81_001447 [Batrachochytrium salamandrivorans]|nr:hypothetical protein BASA81_001447 [Batrachochytrium salamandrivorans]
MDELKLGKDRDSLPFDLIICDDLAGDKQGCRNSEALRNLYVAGRHLNFAVIFLSQYFTAIPPEIRSNTDFVVCFTLSTETDQKRFVEEYLSVESNAIGFEILRKNTVDVGFQCMVVLNNKNVIDPQEYVRVYTASVKVPKFFISKDRAQVKAAVIQPGQFDVVKRAARRRP